MLNKSENITIKLKIRLYLGTDKPTSGGTNKTFPSLNIRHTRFSLPDENLFKELTMLLNKSF